MLAALKKSLYDPARETVHVRKAMRALLSRVPQARSLLDVGCGDGKATLMYASLWNLPPESITGVEPQQKYIQQLTSFKTHALDIERQPLPFADRSFDVLVCNEVVEHLKMVIAAMREMVRVTREGGYLAIGFPNLSALISRVFLLFGKEPISLSFPGVHFRGYTHRAWLRFLRSNPNLRVEAVNSAIFYPLPVPLSEPVARLLPGMACYTFYLVKKIRHAPENDWPASQVGDEEITG